jgi:hypothetical protein
LTHAKRATEQNAHDLAAFRAAHAANLRDKLRTEFINIDTPLHATPHATSFEQTIPAPADPDRAHDIDSRLAS